MSKYIKRQVIPVKFKVGDIVTMFDQSQPYPALIGNVSIQNGLPLYDFGGGLRLTEKEINVNCNPERYDAALGLHLQEFPDE